MFPYKANTNGLYPYYPNCLVRNLTNEFFCFNPQNASTTLNTFIVGKYRRKLNSNKTNWTFVHGFCWLMLLGMYDDDFQFRLDQVAALLQVGRYKCCRTPPGYFIDYTSCYYKPTRDQYWEYYDNIHFVVYCDTSYIVTGMAKKINPYDDQYHLEWVQCCRLGFLPLHPFLPPVVPVAPAFKKQSKYYVNPFNRTDSYVSKYSK